MVACGVLPIDRMTQHREAVQVVANRVGRSQLQRFELLETLCRAQVTEKESRCNPVRCQGVVRKRTKKFNRSFTNGLISLVLASHGYLTCKKE